MLVVVAYFNLTVDLSWSTATGLLLLLLQLWMKTKLM